jgi:hypothetical protein
VTTDLETAQRLNADAASAYQRIRDNARLTPEAMTASMAKVWVKLRDQLDVLKASAFTTPAVDRKALEVKLWGIADLVGKGGDLGSLSASYRDARDRAAAAETGGSLMALFTGAEAVGDELLARACAAQVYFGLSAFGADTTVLEQYLAERPAASATFVLLQDSRSADLTGNMLYAWNFVATKPSELGSMSDSQIATLAASPLAA